MMKQRYGSILSGWIFVFAFGCESNSGPQTGSETHFLMLCSEAADCGADYSCVCGACTRECSVESTCAAVDPGAVCLSREARPTSQSCGEPLAATCELICSVDEDCQEIGAAHFCDRGLCRQGDSSCISLSFTPDEVVLFGDRFLSDTGEITAKIEEIARASGTLEASGNFRDFSSQLVTPFGGAMDLASQFASAKDETLVRLAILNAGGSDSLLTCTSTAGELCPTLQNAVEGARALLSDMAMSGVEQVVLFFYPDPDDAELKSNFDQLRPLLKIECEASVVPCSFLDLRFLFEDHQDEYLESEGIIPTEAGSEATAGGIWSILQTQCALPE
jgi:hypothetical protein